MRQPLPAVKELAIYPVKGMRGLALASARVERRGLAGDRRYLAVDAEGMFVTQRDDPVLATIQPRLILGGVRLERDGSGAVEAKPTGDRSRVTIWRSQVDAVDCGDEAAAWLSAVLARPCRLVHMDDAAVREIDPDYGRPGEHVSFADGFPLLLANEASRADLNRRMDSPLPMNRFRANVVVSGAEAWAEDGWATIQIGEVAFRNVKPCGRCLVTTTDQQTGERVGDEPLRALATFRKVDGKVMFGVNLIPDGTGEIHVGDAVVVR